MHAEDSLASTHDDDFKPFEAMAHLARKIGADEARAAAASLLSNQLEAGTTSCLESTIEAAVAAGHSLDELAGVIWGSDWTWDQVQKLNARAPEVVQQIWKDAGYTIRDVGSFELGAVKVIDGLEFVVTDHAEMSDLPHPEFSCLVGVYDAETADFLDVMETFSDIMAVDAALPGLAEKAAQNR